MSESIKIELEVSKETYEAAIGIVNFIKAAKKAGDDGWSIGEDVPTMLNEMLTGLIPSLQGVTLIDEEFRDSPSEFIAALTSVIPELASIFVKKV